MATTTTTGKGKSKGSKKGKKCKCTNFKADVLKQLDLLLDNKVADTIAGKDDDHVMSCSSFAFRLGYESGLFNDLIYAYAAYGLLCRLREREAAQRGVEQKEVVE